MKEGSFERNREGGRGTSRTKGLARPSIQPLAHPPPLDETGAAEVFVIGHLVLL